MKYIIALFALLAVALSASAQSGPVYASQTVSIPTVLTASTNFVTPILIMVNKQDKVTFQADLGTATLQTNTYILAPTVDGISYDTNAAHSFICQNLGGTRTSSTNYTLNGAMGFFLLRMNVTDTTIANTNSLKYGIKISAP